MRWAAIAIGAMAMASAFPERAPSASVRGDEWRMDDPPAIVARRLRDATDKRAFYDRALAIGGGGHLLMAREAAVQCIDVQWKGMVEVERNVSTFLLRRNDGQYARRLAAYRSIFQGCEGFETRPLARDEWSDLNARIAAQPDLTGLAFRGIRWDEDSHPQVVKLLRALIVSGDPHLIEIAGHRLRSHEHQWQDRAKWTAARQEKWWRDEAAWEWALCDLGKECGPESRYGRRICAIHGLCEWGHIDEIAARVWNTQHGSVSRERKEEIVSAIRARDWARLGL
jgi:hypothetical protein